MKLTVFFTFLAVLEVSASAYSQNVKFNFTIADKSFEKVIKEIRRTSEFKFLYQSDLFDMLPNMSYDARESSIEEIMDALIVPHGFEYEISDKTVIFRKPPPKGTSDKGNIEKEDVNIKGRVLDEQGGGLPGAAIVVEGVSAGTVSDVDGNFSLTVPESATLTISFVGYDRVTIPVSGRTYIEVVMQPDMQALEEVIVVGYGTIKKSDLTGAVTAVSTDNFDKIAGSSPLNALQGRSPGIQITNNSGLPGSGSRVSVRGVSSVNTGNGGGSSPIFVVDGVISSSIDHINQNNIEAISVLKDASAAAIYGARAANGVIVVTTKRGSANKEPQITFNTYVGISKEGNLRHKMLNANQFLELWTESYENAGLPIDWSDTDMSLYNGVDTNWKDLMLQSGKIQSYDLSVSGGGQNSNYFVSANIVDQEGMVIETGQKKYTFRINTDHKIREWIKFGNSLNLSSNAIRGSEANYRKALTKVPLTLHKQADGDWGSIIDSGLEHFFANPVWEAQTSNDLVTYNGVQGNIYLTIAPIENLEITARRSLNYSVGKRSDFTPGIPAGYGWAGTDVNTVYKSSQENVYWINDYLANYSFSAGQDHQFKVLAGYSKEQNTQESLWAQRTGTPNNEIQYLDAGDPVSQVNGNGITDWAFMSMFGRINYSFRDKYLFAGTIRRDGTSRLAEGHRWGVFPSASIAWRISEERLLKGIAFIDDLKVRASYGELGNVNSVGIYGTVASLGDRRAVIDNGPAIGYTMRSAVNQNVTWESARKRNVGIDAAFLEGRLYTTIDYFYENTFDMIFGEPIPRSTGLTGSPAINGGNLKNTGFEAVFGVKGVKSDWSYDVSVNLTHIKNEVTDLAGRDEINLQGNSISYRHMVGYPVHSFYGYKSNGIIRSGDDLAIYEGGSFATKQVGDIAIQDIDGFDEEGNLTGAPDGIINSADRTIIGKRYPNLMYGAVGTVSYKNISLQLQLQGVQGVDEFYGPGQSTDLFQLMTSFAQNEDARIMDRYHPTKNPGGEFPLLNKNASGKNAEFSDFWLQDASFLRVQNITLSYDFDKDFISKVKMDRLGIYMSVQNAYTFTKNKNPEVGNATATGSGIQTTVTGVPIPRVLTFGLKAAF